MMKSPGFFLSPRQIKLQVLASRAQALLHIILRNVALGLTFSLIVTSFSLMAAPKNYVKPPQNELKEKLTPLQYKVTQEEGTEQPFHNAYWDNKKEGIYVDVTSGEPLFSSQDKFDSGTGWPSFTKPIDSSNIATKKDMSLGSEREEVRSRHGNSHLGHVFDDGPGPTRQRYCINSAALRFIPVEKLEAEGYGDYLPLFQNQSVSTANTLKKKVNP